MTHRRSAVGDQGRGTLCRDQRCDILTGRGTPRRALPKSSGTFHVPCCTENRELEVLATLISYPACICDICVICGQNGSNGSVGRNSTLCIPCTLWSKFRSSNRARRSVPLPLVCIYIRIVSVQSVVNTVQMDRLLEAPRSVHSVHSVVKIPIHEPGTTKRAPPIGLYLYPDRICAICG